MSIRWFKESDLDEIVRLSLRAWAPVFVSIEREMDGDLFRHFFPDWRNEQRNAVMAVCADPQARIWVWDCDGGIAGFAAVYQRPPDSAEIYMIAVDPEFQKRGIGKALIEHATEWMRENGIQVAMVETGADPGHGPARQLYEKAGFRLWPVARYYRVLTQKDRDVVE